MKTNIVQSEPVVKTQVSAAEPRLDDQLIRVIWQAMQSIHANHKKNLQNALPLGLKT